MWLPILYRKRWSVQFLTAKKLIKLQLLKICWKYNCSKNCFNPQMIKNTVFFYKQTSSMIWSGNKVVVQMFCLTFRLCRHRHWHWGEKRDVENLPAAFILSVFSFFFFSFVSAIFISLFLCFFLSFFRLLLFFCFCRLYSVNRICFIGFVSTFEQIQFRRNRRRTNSCSSMTT
jgi:hypothetical protein